MRKCETFGCPNQGATMYRLGPGTIVWLCTLCIDVNRRNVDPRQGLGDAWQTYVNAGDIFGEFQSRSPALPASTCGFRHRRGCEEFSAPGSRRRVPRKPGGMRLPPGGVGSGRTGDLLLRTLVTHCMARIT